MKYYCEMTCTLLHWGEGGHGSNRINFSLSNSFCLPSTLSTDIVQAGTPCADVRVSNLDLVLLVGNQTDVCFSPWSRRTWQSIRRYPWSCRRHRRSLLWAIPGCHSRTRRVCWGSGARRSKSSRACSRWVKTRSLGGLSRDLVMQTVSELHL